MIKQHNQSGLKYFCKTTRNNPLTYLGSGRYWKRHLAIHGKDISTLWCYLYHSKQELIDDAISFSASHNIVKSVDSSGQKIWANEKNENGLDGGSQKGRILSESCRAKLSIAGKQRIQTELTKNKIKMSKQGKKRSPFSQEWKDNLSNNHRSKKGYVLTLSESTKQQIATALSKPIYCVTNDTIYPSRKIAALELSLNVTNIYSVIAGRQKSTGGFVFRQL
jgi:hypothetical protein